MSGTTVTVRPTSTPDATDWTFTGAGSYEACLADSLDSSYCQNIATAGYLKVRFTTPSIPTGAQVRTVTPRYRFALVAAGPGTDGIRALLTSVDANGNEFSESSLETITAPLGAVTFTTYTGRARVTDPNGGPWTAVTLQNTRVAFRSNIAIAYAQCQMAAVYLDVFYNQAPTASVTAPTGTITATTRPLISWTYADPEGDTQERYYVKLFTAATIAMPGFNADTFAPFWYSGEVYSSATSVFPSTDLPNGSYTAYVKVADVGSNGRVSVAWATSAFTVSLTPPPAPSLTVAYDGTYYRNVLTLQGFTNLASANQADVETDTTGFVVVTNCTLTRSTLQASNGAASLAIKSVASGTMSAATTRGTGGWPVAGSTVYTGYAELRAAVSARTCRVGIEWYDSGGSAISQTYSGTAVDSTSAWTIYRPTGTSPSNAVTADIIKEIQSTGAANETHYADKIGLWAGTGTTWTRGGLSASMVMVVEFSDDSGTTWAPIRYSPFTPSSYEALSANDYELPAGVARIYRARVTSTDAVGNILTSDNSASTSPLTFTIPRPLWRLVDPFLPLNSVFIRPKLPDEEAIENMGVFHPLGRTYPVVVSSDIEQWGGTFTCVTVTEAEAVALELVFRTRNPLWLVSPSGSQNRYIRLLSPRKRPRIGGSLARTWTAQFVPARRP